MKRAILLSVCLLAFYGLHAQTNMLSTNPVAEQVMLGNYNPATYQPSVVINKPNDISKGINDRVSADSLKSYMLALNTFQNRNTGSDTISNTKGIGAARRWAYGKFEQFSSQNENRLITSYLQFDQLICNMEQHRNVFAVLPGTDVSDKSIIIVEAHLDSRCADNCDTSCIAQGMEDNATGSALVLELARIMSKYSFKNTIVFILTTSEEQGLNGARAFAKYCKQKGIEIKAVLNNDVVGSVICGQTASPPGCMGAETIDSTNLRIFSSGGFNSPHKQLARFIKLEYKEMLADKIAVPMTVNIMTPIDRSGRGGDHIPFTDEKYTSIRFCAANEHGNADVSNPNYSDRQHTSGDIIGLDTDMDMIVDYFYIDFNYLARMTIINGNAAAMAGIGPATPEFDIATTPGEQGLSVFINTQKQYQNYRVAVRSTTNDWDSVFTITGSDHGYVFTGDMATKYISVASVDADGVESLFSEEKIAKVSVNEIQKEQQNIELLQNRPNPFDGETVIGVFVAENAKAENAFISVTDITGKEIKRLPISLHKGVNEVTYEHGYGVTGSYTYTLVVNGEKVQSKRMIFAN